MFEDRILYIHPMTSSGARLLAAVFRASGTDARVTPPSDARTLELGAMHSSGDECLPEKITIGDYLKVLESDGFDPAKTAFFMPSANGPCRFGQYRHLLRAILDRIGYSEIPILSPSSANGYRDVKGNVLEFFRSAWNALLASDILRKMLLKTRPYERVKGSSDRVYEEGLRRAEAVLERGDVRFGERRKLLRDVLVRARDEYRALDADYVKGRPLIIVLGEIFCRHNRFANEGMIRKLEEHGAETWLADVGEWIYYTDWTARHLLKRKGKAVSAKMAGSLVKTMVMRRDEHFLTAPFHEDFTGCEEPEDVETVVRESERYLPVWGAYGEMTLSIGKSGYCWSKGADGVVDISPFSCMNGIVSEAVYPSFSADHDGIPCRVFYYDGVNRDLDRDIGIFMELVRGYMSRKRIRRVYPPVFREP